MEDGIKILFIDDNGLVEERNIVDLDVDVEQGDDGVNNCWHEGRWNLWWFRDESGDMNNSGTTTGSSARRNDVEIEVM